MDTCAKGKMPSVYIVILNWNQLADTRECIKSLKGLDYQNYHIVMVDNGSVDGSADIIQNDYPEVTVLRNPVNLGFAAGNNVGIEHALEKKAEYVFLLNNDTVLDAKIISKLVEIAQSDAKIALLGPQMFYYDQPRRLWFLHAKIRWPFAKTLIWGRDETDPYPDTAVLDSDFIAGAGMFIRARVLRELGMLDPNYFIYFEDADLSVRFLRGGYKVKAVSAAHLWHKVSSSAAAGKISNFLVGRNQLYFCRKFNPPVVFWFKTVPYLLYYRLKEFIFRSFNADAFCILAGMCAYFAGCRKEQGIDWVKPAKR